MGLDCEWLLNYWKGVLRGFHWRSRIGDVELNCSFVLEDLEIHDGTVIAILSVEPDVDQIFELETALLALRQRLLVFAGTQGVDIPKLRLQLLHDQIE